MPPKILVVEDNEKNRRLLRDLLSYHGYEISEAENGATGVRIAQAQRPDLIFMDIQMPVLDGFGALALLRELEATREIKVIALTSFAMVGDQERIMQAGFDGYLSKPIDTRALPLIVKKYLENPRGWQGPNRASPDQRGEKA